MGLDMYIQTEDGLELFYWRKANAIHGWFERHITEHGAIENCDMYPVTKQDAENLIEDCETVLSAYDSGNKVLFERLAYSILPTTPGFFFGSYEYDKYYVQDLRNTIDGMNKVLDYIKDEQENVYYTAWW